MKLILLGAPGAGKGTQSHIICRTLGIPTISTGDIIRHSMEDGTESGLAARQCVEAGRLVPDEIVTDMLRERLGQDDCKNGFILDGFPRTLPQAKALVQMGAIIDYVVDIEVRDEVIEKRLSGRRICKDCGAAYHTQNNPSRKGDYCEECGGGLITRRDDTPAVIRDRIKIYHEQTEPLRDYYNAAGKLVVVDGEGDIEETAAHILAALEA